jgi:hypothetical protein
MQIINLQAENFRILKAIEISPEGNVVTIGGKNGQGKSSVLDAIWVALAGRSKAPPTPIRNGEQKCTIRLDLGDIVVTRTLNAPKEEGKPYTDSVKVESADGSQRFNKPQIMLDELLGQIGFDPFAFVQKKPEDQAEMLLQLVPLPIDLEELARGDTADFANRRDINREAAALDAQIAAIPVADDLPAAPIDRDAILSQLSSAADTNTAIERERIARGQREERIKTIRWDSETAAASAVELRARAAKLIEEAEGREADAQGGIAEADRLQGEFDALPALDEPVDTGKLREELAAAESTNSKIAEQARRAGLIEQRAAKVAAAQALTDMMDAREEDRRKALAAAKMPIEGLGFAINDKGKPVVLFNGLPFGDASSAEQIRASTAIAMSANPDLRVLRIKDGSLLDDDAREILAQMAAAEDFQLWVEVVGTGGVGIVIEDGSVKGQRTIEDAPKAEKAKADAPADKLL